MATKLDFDFLAINKDYFKLGLNPTEILILSQIAEFNRNTGDCFMSDKAFAEAFGVSESTISREMKKLEKELGFITRVTTNKQKGKERHIKINNEAINKKLASVNLTVVECNEKSANVNLLVAEEANCLLRKQQNDLIKEKNEEKREKDNFSEIIQPTAEIISLSKPEAEVKEEAKMPEVEVEREMTMEEFKREFADNLILANTNQLKTKGIIIIFGKTYKIVA